MATAISYIDDNKDEYLSLYPKRASFDVIRKGEFTKYGDSFSEFRIVNVASTQHDARLLRIDLERLIDSMD